MAAPIEFNDEVLEAGLTRAGLSLVGRLLCSNHPSRIRVQHMANNLWAKRAPVTVLDAKHELFQLVFSSQTDRQEALKKAPWFIDSKIFTFKEWETPSERLYHDLARVPYLVQFWNLPEEYRTVALGRLLASRLGTVEEAGMYAVWQSPGCVFKAKILIDVSAPLEHKLEARKRAADGSVGETFRVKLKYENLKVVCFRCRRIGHNQESCSFDLVTGDDGSGPEIFGKRTGSRLNENSNTSVKMERKNWTSNVWRNDVGPAAPPLPKPLLLEGPNRRQSSNRRGRSPGNLFSQWAAKSQGEKSLEACDPSPNPRAQNTSPTRPDFVVNGPSLNGPNLQSENLGEGPSKHQTAQIQEPIKEKIMVMCHEANDVQPLQF
ncbi:unnamed protein product [Linum trigynum]|uniref:CCHC-type domain-containing protein n=1 Tax=Linum trigynum TaxID=586398 RepID=A0AAV2CT73_9ROSI